MGRIQSREAARKQPDCMRSVGWGYDFDKYLLYGGNANAYAEPGDVENFR